MIVLSAALAAGAAAALSLGPRPRLIARPTLPQDTEDVGALRRWRGVVAAAALVGGWALLGGVLGVGVGTGAAWACWRVLGASEGPAAARRRQQLAADIPTAVDLLASCVQAGAAVESSLLVVADAVGGPLAEELRGVHHHLSLGVDPATAWGGLATIELRPLARAVLRAHESGAAVSDAVARLADDLREAARADVQARASSVEVRAAGPLAACFLPAFVLLAVVPLVAGMVSGLELLR